jgi:hypothetical protein
LAAEADSLAVLAAPSEEGANASWAAKPDMYSDTSKEITRSVGNLRMQGITGQKRNLSLMPCLLAKNIRQALISGSYS